MKLDRIIIAAVIALLFVSSCKKVDDPTGISAGTLKDTTTGACLPVVVNGIFMVDSVLTNDNYVDVQANVSVGGSFEIRSDSVNGYSFHKSGTLSSGLNVIRLYASGKPLATGVNTFHITYGLSSCSFNITVYTTGSGSGTALYTLGGSPGNCSITSLTGNYVVGQAMTAANKVEMTVNVTTPGTYSITGAIINGVSFNANGVFTNPGVQNIFLSATGTPVAAGSFTYPVTNTTTSCNFQVIFITATPAVYTLGGSPGNCTGVVLAGTYMAGTSTSAANMARVDVNVTSTGSYSLTTTTVNNIQFSASGNFTLTGPQTVTLTANTAIPAAQGTFNYPITGAGTSCTFPVTYLPAPPPASFTLSGGPGNCTPATVNGIYTAGTALTASNNIVVEVNVTVAGAYTISTNTVNGMQFTKTGVFSATGLQNVTLAATAGSNPTAPGTSTLTPLAGSSSCTIDITVGAPSDRVYSFKIGTTTYSGPCSAFLVGIGGGETMNIYDPGNSSALDMDLISPSGAITPGFYSGTSTAGKYTQFAYGLQFASFPGSGLTNLSATITSLNTVTRVVQGTFTGTVSDLSLNIFTITNGTFKADY